MKAILILSVLLTSYSYASKPAKPKLKPGQYAVFMNETYRVVESVTKDQLVISKNCGSSCLAINALKKKEALPRAPHSAMQNPAAQYCKAVGGTNLIAINSNGAEENLCTFSDNSFVNSWDLFYKRFPKSNLR
ncbi:MAG: hypothetical protein OM95_08000 [Bdellovibrio sp. ArHS]|uniref:putative hemolysin n=1 Tax=Bdellovibrio sp. ArHS TaxID=1569284 RepID=UPI0005823C38|nr:DUF333 domain-containing protein [Bdellovibrio sp. ArHS]KHD88728.1 MAG: hypothetical protein OM95_08000 [Bdellovibrio sp. ArHS]